MKMTSMISREIQIWQLKYVNQAYISLEYQFQYMAETQSVNSKKKKKMRLLNFSEGGMAGGSFGSLQITGEAQKQ